MLTLPLCIQVDQTTRVFDPFGHSSSEMAVRLNIGMFIRALGKEVILMTRVSGMAGWLLLLKSA